MELKHIYELSEVIDDFIDFFGCTEEIGTDFAYYPNDEVITWSIFMTDKSDKYFNEYVSKEFPEITADIFLWSLLHEVGHHMTYWNWSDEQRNFNDEIKETAEKILSSEEGANPSIERYSYFLYFSAPDERRATEWAAHYMETHSEKVEKFWLKFTDEFNKFVYLNKVKDFQ